MVSWVPQHSNRITTHVIPLQLEISLQSKCSLEILLQVFCRVSMSLQFYRRTANALEGVVIIQSSLENEQQLNFLLGRNGSVEGLNLA